MYNLLTDATNGVTDPESRSLARTKWVFPTFPDEFGSDFPKYPIITLECDLSHRPFLFGREGRDIAVAFTIRVFAKKNENIDKLADEIMAITNTYQSTLEAFKLFNPTVTSTGTSTFGDERGKVHMKMIIMDYEVKSL